MGDNTLAYEKKDASSMLTVYMSYSLVSLGSRGRGRVVKRAVIVIDTVWVQNLLAPFCCVL